MFAFHDCLSLDGTEACDDQETKILIYYGLQIERTEKFHPCCIRLENPLGIETLTELQEIEPETHELHQVRKPVRD